MSSDGKIEMTDDELLEAVRKELRFLIEHDGDNGGRIVEGLEALIDMRIAIAANEIADRFLSPPRPTQHPTGDIDE